jgi:WD40 repeat protein
LDKTIEKLNLEAGYYLRDYRDKVTFAAFSPDETKIVSGSYDKTIKEWNTNTGKCLKIYNEHPDAVNSVNYSLNGDKIISASDDGTIKEWDIYTGKCIRTIQNIPGLLIQGVDMRNLHPDSEISDKERDILKQYGAILD